ncbi:TetR/AcrR family transcriptional regulator [Methanoregula sp.]|jgi:AcrR family transcriptional regulator|uniref:TetR/AcrR family transcriptional regulator n=1 Tax=Methanoregula sp. TaxID=2052170 RepID=UPI003C7254F8
MPKVVPEYKEEAKKKILSAGREVMSRKGYRATTMDDIAEYIGVSKAALYQYFSSKDELVIEIVKAYPEQIREKTMSMYPAATPLDAWIAVLDFYLENDAEQNALFFELLSMIPGNPEIAKSFSENMQLGLQKATQGVAEQQRLGLSCPGGDPRTIALAILSLFHGLRVLSLVGVERDELRERWIEIGKILLGETMASTERSGKRKKGERKQV